MLHGVALPPFPKLCGIERRGDIRQVEEIRLTVQELKRARALGDLSENAEYHMAKQRQDIVGARLVQLKRRLASLSLINFNNIPRDRIAFGSRVKLYDVDRDSEIEYKLVTSEEADFSKGLISTTSPIGRALMGKQVGDAVKVGTPNGMREFEVRSLRTIYDKEA